MSLFEDVGGFETLNRVHKRFYTSVYNHSWMSQFFSNTNRSEIENQQTTFMAKIMGGPNEYAGKMPKYAHIHMFLTTEMVDIRHDLLKKAILAEGVSVENARQWLLKDWTIAKTILKKSPSECKPRYDNDPILNFPI
jgi:hemoglobin